MMITTARQRLAQRALRQLDTSLSSPCYKMLSGLMVADLENSINSIGQSNSSDCSSPIALLRKHGFNVELEEKSSEDFLSSETALFKEPDDLRTLSVVVSESDHCFFVSKDYLCAWSEQFRQFNGYSYSNQKSTESSYNAKRVKHEEFHFPGNEAQLLLLLNVVWPFAKRFSLEHIVDIIKLCSQWVMQEALSDVAAYFLYSCIQVGPSEKLKLVSLSGNLLLLYGTLTYQCKRETIFELVNQNAEDYAQIRKGTYASMTISRMLEHAAGEGDSDYKDNLNNHLTRELNAFKRRLSESVASCDFTRPSAERTSSSSKVGADVVELLCEGTESFFVNKSYLATWSPVFYQMFYGDFRDRAQSKVRLGDRASPRAFRLFLTLLHPSRACAALKMLPREYTRNARTNQWLDDIFLCVFEDDAELLMEVFKLAHKYQIGYLVDVCLVFVETKCEFSLSDKMLMADAYHLPTLMAMCLARMNSPRVVKRMVADNENLLGELSCKAHRLLLERLVTLV